MRFSASTVANLVAWAAFAVLIGVALLVTDRLGFVGLMLLGGLTSLVCTRAEIDQDVPTWGVAVFRARMAGAGTPERQAAMHAERMAFIAPLRFYSRCGAALIVIGAAGFIWQQL